MTLKDEEIKILTDAKNSNPHYFKALIQAASIGSDRRKKYGDTDPYANFKIMLYIMQIWFADRVKLTMRDIFIFFQALKFARKLVSGNIDFKDESKIDTRIDEANYNLLDVGDIINEDLGITYRAEFDLQEMISEYLNEIMKRIGTK